MFSKSKLGALYTPLRALYGLSRLAHRVLILGSPRNTWRKVPFYKEYKHNFCGYYGNSPFAPTNEDLILVHSTNASILRNPSPSNEVVIRVVDWRSGAEIERLGRTNVWNWQQGSRALWCGKERWIYNAYDADRKSYISVTGNLGTQKTETLPWPVQEVSEDGACYSISYSALSRFRPDYGYFNKEVTSHDIEMAKLVEFVPATGYSSCLITVQQLREDVFSRTGVEAKNYKINHVLSSPSGRSIIFMFRYHDSLGKRITDVYCYDRDNASHNILIPNCDVSHYCWLCERVVLFTGKVNELFGYHTVNIDKLTINIKILTGDGHPIISKKGSVITDTYPDKKSIRRLIAYRLDNKMELQEPRTLAEFVEPWYLWGQRRCDLHPSVSRSGEYIQVDAVTNGRRTVFVHEA